MSLDIVKQTNFNILTSLVKTECLGAFVLTYHFYVHFDDILVHTFLDLEIKNEYNNFCLED